MSREIRPPLLGTPHWTVWAELESNSEPTDPLRFDMYAQRIGNVLLPGITNRVERLRYFGMVCAGVALTRPDRARPQNPQFVRDWRRRFLPFEAGWAMVTVIAVNGQIKDVPPAVERARLKWEYQGFRGANRVLDYFRRTQRDDAVKPANYVLLKAQEAQGGLGSYLVALRRYGFVHPERFELTPLGQELAARFLRGTRYPAQLGAGDRVRRRMLATLGERLSLARNPSEEAELVRAAVFTGDHEAAVVLRRIPKSLRRPDRSEEAMTAIARRDGDPLERAAQYALDFDPLRRCALLLFSQLGRALIGRAGPATLREVVDSRIEETCAELRPRAAVLADDVAPPGLEPVSAFSQRLTTSASEVDAIQTVVAFHRQEGRRWIEAVGSRRLAVALPGRFDSPRESFHGYTLPSALRIYRDLEEST